MSTETQTLFERGKQLLDEKKTTEAISAFAKAISFEPNNSEYRAWYAQALIANKQYDEAIQEGSFAVQLDPQNAKGFRQRGYANFCLRKYDDAIKDISQATLVDNDVENIATALKWRGDAYRNLKKYEMAIQDYTRVIEFDAKNYEAYLQRGNCFMRLKKYDLAIQDCTTTLEIDKNNSEALFQRGLCFYNLKDYKSAIRDFSQAIDLEPKSVNAFYWRAYSYYKLNNYENYLLDKSRYHERDGEVDLFSKEGTVGDGYILFLDTINKHLSESLLPLLKTRKETIVAIFPFWIMLWGHYEQQRMVNGGSFNQEVGTYGQGYICLTAQSVHIISIGGLYRNVRNVVKNPFSFLLGMVERFEYSKTDQFWSIPNNHIKDVQIKNNDSLKKEFILLRTDEASWELYPFFEEEKELYFTALNMARAGKFNNIWSNEKAKNSSSSETLELIKQLGDLKIQNIITEAEFENKKKELLSRI